MGSKYPDQELGPHPLMDDDDTLGSLTMTTTYLPDATDFSDMTLKPHPGATYPDKAASVVCPKCHGYGGWNLRLHAYRPKPGSDTREHFQASCDQCWGWGFVSGPDATCVHTFTEIAPDQPWYAWHTIQCVKCGTTKSYSSDD